MKQTTTKRFPMLLFFLACGQMLLAQTNILITNPLAEQILLGNYNPADYAATTVISDLAATTSGIHARVSPDSLKNYLIRLSEFGTRNTSSDTVSATTGIGAARRWTHQKLESFSAANENRLVVSYLQFNQDTCGMGRHRNIFAVLPGSNPANNGVILIEGHIDSRCAVLCDVTCQAEGVEDNATGTALVLELARVMAQYTFENTLVFVATWISFFIKKLPSYRQARILITDLNGRIVQQIPVSLQAGLNEVLYTHGYGQRGTFAYALQIDGRTVDARQMVFAN